MNEGTIVKRNIKDTVFTNLFSDLKYLLQLYQCLHPEDTDVTADKITNVTLKPVMTNAIYNDLGFMVEDRLVLLVEAQSTWTENIVVRSLLYLAQTYQEYLERTDKTQNIYSLKKISIPKPELYVIYTGGSPRQKDVIRLSEEFFGGDDSFIDVKVRVLYDGKDGDILNQYVAFTKVANGVIRKYGRTEEAAREIFRICCDRNILREYLKSKEREVMNIMIALFDDEHIQEIYIRSLKQELKQEYENAGIEKGIEKGMKKGMKKGIEKGIEKGMKKGMEQEKKETISRMLKKNLSFEDIADFVGVSVSKVKEIAETLQ